MSRGGHHHEALGRVLEHQDAQLPRVGQQQLEVHLGQELVVQDAWGPAAGQEGAQREVRGPGVTCTPT